MIVIKDKYQCCGCSACVQKCPKQCIRLIEDNEGFLYPKVKIKECVECGLCEDVCPLHHEVPIVEPIKVLAAYNTNEEVRMKSSSGGIFTLLAEKTINEGGVVFGARFNDKWEVILDYTETIDGVGAFRGSKYVQAQTNNTFRECEHFLKVNRQVLFSGTPCQIAGLKKYLGKEYDNLLTVDVVCHGVPSPMIWRRYLQELVKEHNTARRAAVGKSTVSSSLNDLCSIKNITFRDKTEGWKKFRFVLQFAEASAEGNHSSVSSFISEGHRDNLFMQAFLSDLILRPSCYSCPFRGKHFRQSDVSIADYWGIHEACPDFDDEKGISLVLINTDKGNNVVPLGLLDYIDTDLTIAPKYNGGLRESIDNNPRRKRFFREMKDLKSFLNVLSVHVLPEDLYQQAITPLCIKILRTMKSGLSLLIRKSHRFLCIRGKFFYIL